MIVGGIFKIRDRCVWCGVEIDYEYRYHGLGWIGVGLGWNWGGIGGLVEYGGMGFEWSRSFFLGVFLCRRKERKKEVSMFIYQG